jgi:predicted aldo/keto reductase-like oxidoreductase
MKRRTFLGKSIQAGLALSSAPLLDCSGTPGEGIQIPKRKLGRTGEKLSVIGFGGILVMNETSEGAATLVSRAIDLGINYFDVAPSYGNAEDMLGPAFRPHRKNCFLACKTTERLAEGAAREMNASLKKLQTDHFDLYQLHALSSTEDVEKCFGPGGTMEMVRKAKEAGKVRFIGFSAHSQEAALLAIKKFDFDTILMPFNYVCFNRGHFGQAALEAARKKGMGILALKALALTIIPEGQPKPYEKMWYIPIEDNELASLSLRYTMSLGVTATIPPGDVRFWEKAVMIAQGDLSITEEEIKLLDEKTKNIKPLFSSTA